MSGGVVFFSGEMSTRKIERDSPSVQKTEFSLMIVPKKRKSKKPKRKKKCVYIFRKKQHKKVE